MQHMSKKNTKLSDFSSMQRHMAHVIPENFLALGAFKWIEKFCRVHKVAREHGDDNYATFVQVKYYTFASWSN